MIYDCFIEQPHGDVSTRLRFLANRGKAATAEYLKLVHGTRDRNQFQRGIYNKLIAENLSLMEAIHLRHPDVPNMDLLPTGSWFLQFTFTLTRPWISEDDAHFYVEERVNPVRKDKVFKVPCMAASSWKGLLRWTAMYVRLALRKDHLGPTEFAQERFVQTLLFGDEKGEESGKKKDFTCHVDLLKSDAREEYERLLRSYYGLEERDPLPHHSGRLSFYQTLFDLIDVEVMNPHSRKTKAGTFPIFLECVPKGAKSVFSLLYVPFDLIGQDEQEIRKQAAQDLQLVAEGIKEMMLTYGFSAKRTSGYGVANNELTDGILQMRFEETAVSASSVTREKEPSLPLPKYLETTGRLKPIYLNSDGTFRERSQAELYTMRKSQLQEYEKAKRWWAREGKGIASQGESEETQALPVQPAQPAWLKREFRTFDELVEKASVVATRLQSGGGQ